MYETAVPGAGYGYGSQQLGPQVGNYGNIAGQYGQPGGMMGQSPFGGQATSMAGIVGQRFGGYQTPQSALPLTLGTGANPFQQIQPGLGQQQFWPWQPGPQQLGQPQFGHPQMWQLQFGQPQFGVAQFGQPPFGQPQFAQPPFAQPPFGQQQLGGLQLGMTQTQVQVIPVVTPQGVGVLLLATGQPLVIGATPGGLPGGITQFYGTPHGTVGGVHAGLGGQIGGLGGYLPLQVQQPIPQPGQQTYGAATPFGAPSFPGQPLGSVPIH